MPYDLAFHPGTGDWLFNGRLDVQTISGPDQMAQRIHTRIRIARGEWEYDDGRNIGSRMRTALRMPRERVVRELPLLVMEALEPMPDVDIVDVQVEESEFTSRQVEVHIFFRPNLVAGTQDVGAANSTTIPLTL